MAVVLAVAVAAGFAAGEDKAVADQKAGEDLEKRREHVERACNKPLNTENDKQICRAAYRALNS